jgi:uncharacterized coiled-coil protein SlyX
MADYEIHDLEMKISDLEQYTIRKLEMKISSLEDAVWRANNRIDDQNRLIEKLRDEVQGFNTLVYGGGGCADLMDTWKQFGEINQRLDRLENKGA